MRIIGFIMTTFMIALIYGLCVTTMDFMGPNYDPVASGHRVASNVYGLFGVVNTEIQRNDSESTPHSRSILSKIAMPYAISADLGAIFGGKLEIGMSSFYHKVIDRPAAPGLARSDLEKPITTETTR